MLWQKKTPQIPLLVFIVGTTMVYWGGPGVATVLRKPITENREEVEVQSCRPCPVVKNSQHVRPINCSVDGAYSIRCQKVNGEVYMPVSFINKYFDVYGEESASENHGIVYTFRPSRGALHPPFPVYDPAGVFLNFHKYGVEYRPSILCVSAAQGVPVATQWDKAGYFYPISTAQFGLSHHAKSISERPNVKLYLFTGEKSNLHKWQLPDFVSEVKLVNVTKDNVETTVLAFVGNEGPTLQIKSGKRCLCLTLQLIEAGGITVKIKTREGKLGYIHYMLANKHIQIVGDTVIYGLQVKNIGKWIWLTRDLLIDWQKGPGDDNDPKTWFGEILSVTLHGKGFLANMSLSTNVHIENFLQASNWMVENQDKNSGAWLTTVSVSTKAIKLAPRWTSAMSQGQAMSLLVRAYNLTQDGKYLTAATKALKPFSVDVKDGGVRTRFLDQLDWYEEYPTRPSRFILNGFIFSLLGLYDVMMSTSGQCQVVAWQLWSSGLKSLKILLGMFDTGEDTLYDLGHVISHTPPNRARWDYHTTHVALLQELFVIDKDPLFNTTAQRWIGYFKGQKIPRN